VYLPAGNWVDFWSNVRHAGHQTITWQSAKRMQFPLFVREGAIIPMLPEDVQTLCERNYVNNPAIVSPNKDLIFLTYPAKDTSQFTVYDDTHIQCQTGGAGRSITLNSIARRVTFQVLGAEPAAGVTLNGQSLSKLATQAQFDASDAGWRFDAASPFLFIKFVHNGGSATVTC
jgi:alpha-glucosidase (family GH31 glycosyl hydrolase)